MVTVLFAVEQQQPDFIAKSTLAIIASVSGVDRKPEVLTMNTHPDNKCDLEHNMCGWFLQWGTNGSRARTFLSAVTEVQAINEAHNLGFDEMAIWDYEQQVRTVTIPKGKNDFNNNQLSNRHGSRRTTGDTGVPHSHVYP